MYFFVLASDAAIRDAAFRDAAFRDAAFRDAALRDAALRDAALRRIRAEGMSVLYIHDCRPGWRTSTNPTGAPAACQRRK